MGKIELPENHSRSFTAAMLGLAGASYAGVFKVMDLGLADRALQVSLWSFTLAVPLLVTLALLLEALAESKKPREVPDFLFAAYLSLHGAPFPFIVGFAALLWHFSIWLAAGFAVLGVSGYVFALLILNARTTDHTPSRPEQP